MQAPEFITNHAVIMPVRDLEPQFIIKSMPLWPHGYHLIRR